MEDDEYPLLNEPNIMLVTLRAAERAPTTPDECARELRANLDRAHETAPADGSLIIHRIKIAFRYLCIAGLLDPDEEGRCTLTERGKEILWDNPNGIDSSVLMVFPEFQSYVRRPNPLRPGDDMPGMPEPTLEFDEGNDAFQAGKGLTDNPYEFDTFAHLEWENGWCEARDDDMA